MGVFCQTLINAVVNFRHHLCNSDFTWMLNLLSNSNKLKVSINMSSMCDQALQKGRTFPPFVNSVCGAVIPQTKFQLNTKRRVHVLGNLDQKSVGL